MLETYLFRQIEYLYDTEGLETTHITEMKISFIREFRFMTYDHYMDMPKHAVERNLIRKIYENPKPIRSLQKMPEPIMDKYDIYLYSEDEDAGDI